MSDFPFEFETSGITFAEVPWLFRWMNSGVVTDIQQSQPFDDEGVGVKNIGGTYYTHPVNLAVFSLTRLDQFVTTQDEEYLELCRRGAERLIVRSVTRDDAAFLPYRFPWNGHHQVASPMPVPWYSGMAQGYALAFFSRMFEITGEEYYLDFAKRVFNSYFLPRDEWRPYFVDAVDGRYLWFEEYANPEGRTGSATNGHIYASFCLHDYWLVSGDERAVTMADGGLTSVLALMDRFRRPGGQSFYGINSPKSTAQYHHWHSRQLGHVFNITGDPLWARLQELFMYDYPTQTGGLEPNSAELVVMPGDYKVGVRGDLTVTDHISVNIPEERRMSINVRAKRYGELETSTRVLEPDLEYIWFTEVPDQVFVSGIIEEATWAHAIEYRVTADAPTLYDFDDQGNTVGSTESNLAVDDIVEVEARASIRGRVHLKLKEGAGDHKWIPAESFAMIFERS